ncbi:hypothetical protein Aca07nite_87850 [Actinoplanes capillaceus]|uniref:Glycosyltransferase 2-like domain-containing protein n=1 Tax=Actinoplanes campanulatus TaxID=113559 RepID=A0ABQ3WZD7_9ACTN|nr:glycosyltransferase [Actinoplanes capillaceus]GID51510.1 hypothetical protein Aca07nite_87850 [Actinoplanes capillaceus]
MTAQEHATSLSVVVVTRERSVGCRRLCAALDSQLTDRHDIAAEVVIVFDGCEAYPWTLQEGRYRVVHLPVRHGIAKARNIGIGHARGDMVAFLDDDAVPAPGWVDSLLAAFTGRPQPIAVGGRVIGSDQENLYAQLRDQVYYLETFGPWYVDPGVGGDLAGPPYVNGGNSVYLRRELLAVGGFDELLPAYSDVELGRRLRLHDRGVLLAGLTIYHDHPSSFREYMRRCYRSGRARGLLWSRRGYRQDAPGRVARTTAANLLWNNIVHRARRIRQGWVRTVMVLSCQEVVHAYGYALALVSTR